LWPVIKGEIARLDWPDKRAFDLGCGNGATCHMLSTLGFKVVGIDPSAAGINQATRAYPEIRAEIGSAYDDLASRYGTFPLVVSLEVIEHCIDPRAFTRTFLSLIAPNGLGILSTPYHGYLKNLALSLANKWDRHHRPLWDGGHIKFFSIATLNALLAQCGAEDVRFIRVGRIPALAKSMIAVIHA
jgi:2-polyprenyl-6-hydroxyphenyl methylase/3-demethylubiquinone-9 3-methyltransferase